MRKNRVVISVLIILFATPIIGVILINSLNSDIFKNSISNYVSKNTQYFVSFNGDLDLGLSSKFTLSVTNFSIKNKEENPNKENLSIEKIYFSIPIVNLINRSYIPEHLIVNELNASIKITDRASEEKTPLVDLLTEVGIKESSITLTEMEHRQTGDSISLVVKDLKASPFGLRVNARTKIDSYQSKIPSLSGNLKIDASNILPMLKLASDIYNIDLDVNPDALNQKDLQLKVNTNIETDKDNAINFNDVKLSILGVHLLGNLKAEDISFKKPKFNVVGTFKTNKIDIDKLQKFAKANYSIPFKFGQLKTSISGSETDLNLESIIKIFTKGAGQNPTITLKNKISELNLSKGHLTINQLLASGLDSNFSAKGSLTFYEDMHADIKYSANIKNFKEWLELFSLENSINLKQSNFKNFKLDGLAKLKKDQIELSQTKLNFDDVMAKIEFSSFFQEKNKFDFVMSVNQINLDRYISSKKTTPITPEAAAVGIVQLPIELLKSLEGKGKIKIGKVLIYGIPIEDIVIALRAKDAIITIKPAEAKVLDGTYFSSLTVDSRKTVPKINLNSKLKNVDLSKIDKTIDVIGKLNFESQLEASGSDSEKLLQSTKGQAIVTLDSGALRYFNATGLIDTVKTIIKCKCPQPLPKRGITVFETASASLNLKPKLNATLDLNVKGSNFSVKGDGYIDGISDFSRYNLVLSMADSMKPDARKGLAIPIDCKGSISKPKCRPNVQPLVKSVIKTETTDKIKGILSDKIKESIGKEAGESLKKLFKF